MKSFKDLIPPPMSRVFFFLLQCSPSWFLNKISMPTARRKGNCRIYDSIVARKFRLKCKSLLITVDKHALHSCLTWLINLIFFYTFYVLFFSLTKCFYIFILVKCCSSSILYFFEAGLLLGLYKISPWWKGREVLLLIYICISL